MSEFVEGDTQHPSATSGSSQLSAEDLARRERADELYYDARAVRQVDYVRLKELSEASLELACEVGSDGEQYRHGMAEALSMLAYYNATLGFSDVAMSQASQAIALLDSEEPSTILTDLYATMGWARFSQGNFVEAIEVLVQAMRMAEEVGDLAAKAKALDTMGSVHEVSGHPADALDEHLRAIDIYREVHDDVNLALARNNLAYTYLSLGDYDSALETAMAALEYVSAHGYRNIEVSVLDTVATVYLEKGDLDAAVEYSHRGLDLARECGSEQDAADNLMTIGRIAVEQERYDEALAAVGEALAIASEAGRAVEVYTAHELLARIYEARGDVGAALGEYRLFHELEQARINEEAQTRLAHLRVENQLESARKDAEIHRLRSLALEREVEDGRIAQARLEAQASLDPLTGLYNRRHLSVLAEELRAAVARQESVCLAIFDIDHFKAVNDTYGHLAGDRVLVSLARQLRSNSRSTDVALRYGGDEFLVLIVGMDGPAGAETAERLRTTVEATVVESDRAQIRVTISAGVTCVSLDGTTDLSALIDRADHGLYAAKQTGRNRVVSM
ncbi:MAG: diguanylate cyclase [Coriobacteriia bacterium]|nr:diguanylate cyclase [Coriobacteriia bacterium]